MTVSINGNDIAAIAEGAAWAGSIVGLLVMSLIVYLLVRPPRHVRERRRAERRGEIRPAIDAADAEEFGALVDRMEARLQVLERALADQRERPASRRRDEAELEHDFAPAEGGRESGRKE